MRLQALIFDVDGTLADTEEAHRQAFNAAFQEGGLEWRWSIPQYARLLSITGGKERLRGYIGSLPLWPAGRRTHGGARSPAAGGGGGPTSIPCRSGRRSAEPSWRGSPRSTPPRRPFMRARS